MGTRSHGAESILLGSLWLGSKTIQRTTTALFTDISYRTAMRAQPGSGLFTAWQGHGILRAADIT